MIVEQSSVAMIATHEYVRESEIVATRSFRVVMGEVSQEVSQPAANDDAQLRLVSLLQNLIARMLEAISGTHQAAARLPDALFGDGAVAEPEAGTSAGRRSMRMEWNSELTESLREHEATGFSASGSVRTADGRNIDFTLGLAMCRDYSCERTLRQSGSVELRDPLVLNFDGGAAELTGQRFAFDLDADGSDEQIPGLAAGSAWLAFDRNADGRINDGSELFGTRSGDGFADLACLDEDGNGWVDEADSAFSSLCLWQRGEEGNDSLRALGETNVGALYLGSAETPFALTDSENARRGYIRTSGVYLREDGNVGTMQQVDLAV